MESSADQSGPDQVQPSLEANTAAAGETASKAAVQDDANHAAAPAKAEATHGTAEENAAAAKAEPEIIDPAKAADAAKAEAATPVSQSARAETGRPAVVGSKSIATTKTPGSSLVALVPPAERFEARQETPDYAVPPNGGRNKLFLYGSRAALAVFVLGGAYVASGQLFHSKAPAPEQHAAAQVPTPQHPAVQTAAAAVPAANADSAAERAELHRATKQMADEIRSLKSSLDSLRNSVAQSQSAEEVRSLKKGLDGVKSGLEATKTETNAAIAQLSTKIEHMQREQTAKLQQMLEKAEHADQKSASAALTTGSVAAAAPIVTANAAPTAKNSVPLPPTQAGSAEAAKKPASQAVSNWVVRDVYDGIALVEGPGGAFEVMQGENIPGVGTVKSIERRGTGWIVVTNHGLVEYARD